MSDFQMLYMCNVIHKHHLLKEMSVFIGMYIQQWKKRQEMNVKPQKCDSSH